MAKAKTYRLWTVVAAKDGESVCGAINNALVDPTVALFNSKAQAMSEFPIREYTPVSFLVRVVPPAKRRAKR